MNPHKIISILKDNLKDIYINKDELDKSIKGFGLDDKKDNIKYLKKNYKKISEVGFLLNTCHKYSPG